MSIERVLSDVENIISLYESLYVSWRTRVTSNQGKLPIRVFRKIDEEIEGKPMVYLKNRQFYGNG